MTARQWHARNVELYRAQLRGDKGRAQWWDRIVLTAADAEQASVFEQQIEQRKRLGTLPRHVVFDVIADPPDDGKVGNGGATLLALSHLRTVLGSAWTSARVLLLHAGGYSKRLPHVSVLGKIFTSMPIESNWSMLELKLVMFGALPSRMIAGGVFVACADDIEVFDSEDAGIDLSLPGVIALAHPSSCNVGESHGVFSFTRGGDLLTQGQRASMAPVRRFIHKPSTAEQIKEGCVVQPNVVFTDSTFFMDSPTCVKLLGVLDSDIKDARIPGEVDAYADFLVALTSETALSTNHEPASTLEGARAAIKRSLSGTPLTAAVLPHSMYVLNVFFFLLLTCFCRFYHIGTLAEYLFHLCADESFVSCLGVERASDAALAAYVEQGGIAMHCRPSEPAATISRGAVIEYSLLGGGVCVPSGSVYSCVDLAAFAAPPPTETPFFAMCVFVVRNGVSCVVPVVFPADMDVKVVSARLNGPLWDAQLFPVCATVREASAAMAGVMQWWLSTAPPPAAGVSLKDCIEGKDVDAALDWRASLTLLM